MLLAHALDVDRLHLYLAPDKPLSPDERRRYRDVVKQRRHGAPLQHLIGEVSFYGLRFRVTRQALIPRPETEELLDHLIKQAPRDREIHCLDLGTGTGVLAVCMARYLPLAQVTAVDVSTEALDLARDNAELNGVLDRVRFVESDWFSNLDGTFDLIAANPPYVPETALPTLPKEIRDHEPKVALDGGPDGLEQIVRICRQVHSRLSHEGLILMEVGHDQSQDVARLLGDHGLVDVQIVQDMAHRQRYVVGRSP